MSEQQQFPGPFPKWYLPWGNTWRIDHFYRDDEQLRRSFRWYLRWLAAPLLWKWSCWLWKH